MHVLKAYVSELTHVYRIQTCHRPIVISVRKRVLWFDTLLLYKKNSYSSYYLFKSNNVHNSNYCTTSTFSNDVKYQVGTIFIMHDKMRSFGKYYNVFHSFASELSSAADVIVLSETWLSVNTCHDVKGYSGFHTYNRPDKTGGGVSCVY